MLAEAGYPDGFEITLTPSIRGAPAEVESCEVIAQMFNDIGLDVNFQRIPYGTLRPQLVGRTYQGYTCHAGSPIPTPAGGYGSYLSANPFNRGIEHPWLEEKMIAAQAEVDPVKRNNLEQEIGIFLLDNALTDLIYYTMDAVWPVGPRLEEWTEHVKTTDVRQINGYEFIQHRK
jgi:ABC-type transport system substrate-binding protein